ncbi:MAG: fasciclin domain-containing protein [Microscillaceae bacterium]|jgi:uncharacterized surface protein with fasciclin (FAS1) repeats|nr:fasciclin domain-containing protein [Microscillaceae bacterium]
MKTYFFYIILFFISLGLCACGGGGEQTTQTTGESNDAPAAGQSGVKDDVSGNDIVKVAVGSKDHSTLVKALQVAEYVDVISNAGPFTVFAPTNAAFDALPKGTLEELTKPEKKADLRTILEYHVAVGGYKLENLQDGQELGMASGHNVKFTVNGDKVKINDANIVATVPATNGIVYVIDKVLLPPKK